MAIPRGRFIWYDLMTTDPKSAAAFYADVIGWSTQDHPMAGGGTYTIFSKGSAMVAGLMSIPDEARARGVPPCWSGYVSTDDVDAEVTRVAAAGGSVKRPPADIPNVGRFAVVADPGGGAFLLFKPNSDEQPKPVPRMAPGHFGWHELMAGNLEREFKFYSGLFGWTKDRGHDMGNLGIYQTFATGGAPCGGMMTVCAQMPRPGWNFYIAVESATAATQRATARGARIVNSAMQVPSGDWIVQARDPQGAYFAMVSTAK